jgi:hypothetical protein
MPRSRAIAWRAIPESTRSALQTRLQRHGRDASGGRCRSIEIRFRGRFAYVDAQPAGDEVSDEAPIHLCRLGYLGNPEHWEFAFYKYSDNTYERSFLPSGSFVGSPEEAFDCAALAYLS